MKTPRITFYLFLLLFVSCTKEPEADFTINFQGSNHAPSIVEFKNSSSNAGSYKWDFGDRTTSEEISPAHTFFQPGTYNVKLTAYNGSKSNECIQSVTILQNAFSFIIHNKTQSTIRNVLAYCFNDSEGEFINIGDIGVDEESEKFYTFFPFITVQWDYGNQTYISGKYSLPTDQTITYYIN